MSTVHISGLKNAAVNTIFVIIQNTISHLEKVKSITDCFVCLFVVLLYVPSQQLWSLRDGQFT